MFYWILNYEFGQIKISSAAGPNCAAEDLRSASAVASQCTLWVQAVFVELSQWKTGKTVSYTEISWVYWVVMGYHVVADVHNSLHYAQSNSFEQQGLWHRPLSFDQGAEYETMVVEMFRHPTYVDSCALETRCCCVTSSFLAKLLFNQVA